MNFQLRLLAVLGLVGLLVAVVWLARPPKDGEQGVAAAGHEANAESATPGGSTSTFAGANWSNDDCRECHEGVWSEWESSTHAAAWNSPHVQAAFRHFGHDRKCESCHAPEPIFAGGLPAAVTKWLEESRVDGASETNAAKRENVDETVSAEDGPRGRAFESASGGGPAKPATGAIVDVALRTADRESGVNCLSCHERADGRSVASRRTIADAPCRPVAEPELGASSQCGVCHTAIFQDWQASRFAGAADASNDERKTCLDCHMPPSNSRAGGRSHACPGRVDESLIRSGVTMNARQEGDALLVEVTNHATGHNFPGERHNRVLLIEVIERADDDDRITLARQHIIKNVTPFRGESSAEEIRAGESHAARFPVVEPPGTADVRLLYKPFPFVADRDAIIVHEAKIPLTSP